MGVSLEGCISVYVREDGTTPPYCIISGGNRSRDNYCLRYRPPEHRGPINSHTDNFRHHGGIRAEARLARASVVVVSGGG